MGGGDGDRGEYLCPSRHFGRGAKHDLRTAVIDGAGEEDVERRAERGRAGAGEADSQHAERRQGNGVGGGIAHLEGPEGSGVGPVRS